MEENGSKFRDWNQESALIVNWTEHMSAYTPQFASSAAFGVFVCVFDILLALVLLLLLVTRDQNRQPFIYRQVCGLVVCDLLFSSLVDPLTVYLESGIWLLGETLCISWHFLDNLLPFIAFVALLTTSADRLTLALAPRRYHAIFQRPGWRVLLLLVPWALGLLIMGPIWLLGSNRHSREIMAGVCMFSINNEANTASAVLALFLPTLVLVVMTVLLLSTLVVGLPPWPEARGRAYVYSGLGKGLDRHSLARRHRGVVLGLCLCNFWTISMQLPYGVLAYMSTGCTEPASCHSIVQLFQGLSWMRSLVVAARCITWLLSLRLPSACADSCRRSLEDESNSLPTGEMELQGLTSSRRHVSGCSTTTYLPCSASSKDKQGACRLSITTEAPPCQMSISTEAPPSCQVTSLVTR